MGAVEIGTLVAIIGCFVGLGGWMAGRDKHIAQDAEWRGKVDAKLDILVSMQSSLTSLTTTVSQHGERIKAVEESTASAHRRINEIKNHG